MPAGGAASVTVTAQDADGDVLTYTWEIAGVGWTVTGQGTAATVAAPNFVGSAATLRVTVTDNVVGSAGARVDVNTIASCPPGFIDCDLNPANGCESKRSGRGTLCPAESCQALRLADDRAGSGVYWVDFDGTALEPARVYCDMTTDDGGWTLVWKNSGGNRAGVGTRSNDELWTNPGVALVLPYADSLGAQKHEAAWQYYVGMPHLEWIKIGSLMDAVNDSVIDTQSIRVALGNNTFGDLIPVTDTGSAAIACTQLQDDVRAYAGGVSLGRTRYAVGLDAKSAGLANTGNGGADTCGQAHAGLINNETVVRRLAADGGVSTAGGLNAVRHLFSYSHMSRGPDASRCFYACWVAEPYYDAFVWGVRRRLPRLAARWPFDGDLRDASGNGHDGAAYGAVRFEPGVAGQALALDGVDDYLAVGHDAALQENSITVALWMKAGTQQPEVEFLVVDKQHGFVSPYTGWVMQGHRDTGYVDFGLCYNNGSNQCTTVISGASLLDDQWHHVAGTYDGEQLRFYVDGLLVDATPLASQYGYQNTREINIGRAWGNGKPMRYFVGTLDDVRIYDGALNDDEIAELYLAGAR